MYEVAPNPTGARERERSSSQGQLFTLTQGAQPSRQRLRLSGDAFAPADQSFGSGGGGGTASVAGPCAWQAGSNAGFVRVSGGGTGDGTVQFTVDANATPKARAAVLTIAGQPSRSPAARAGDGHAMFLRDRSGRRGLRRGRRQRSVFVNASLDTCEWTAATSAPSFISRATRRKAAASSSSSRSTRIPARPRAAPRSPSRANVHDHPGRPAAVRPGSVRAAARPCRRNRPSRRRNRCGDAATPRRGERISKSVTTSQKGAAAASRQLALPSTYGLKNLLRSDDPPSPDSAATTRAQTRSGQRGGRSRAPAAHHGPPTDVEEFRREYASFLTELEQGFRRPARKRVRPAHLRAAGRPPVEQLARCGRNRRHEANRAGGDESRLRAQPRLAGRAARARRGAAARGAGQPESRRRAERHQRRRRDAR